jgi:peptidyl-prolyl cis-trans isomerase B (cyclophilin B)
MNQKLWIYTPWLDALGLDMPGTTDELLYVLRAFRDRDPNGNGSGGPGYSIKGEFTENGWENNLKHKRGVLSMARTDVPDSAGSQFFIMHKDYPSLDGKYAAFGKVTSGMDVVDKLTKTPVTDSNGTVAAKNMPVIKSITIDSDVELPEPDKLPGK